MMSNIYRRENVRLIILFAILFWGNKYYMNKKLSDNQNQMAWVWNHLMLLSQNWIKMISRIISAQKNEIPAEQHCLHCTSLSC